MREKKNYVAQYILHYYVCTCDDREPSRRWLKFCISKHYDTIAPGIVRKKTEKKGRKCRRQEYIIINMKKWNLIRCLATRNDS